MRCVAMTTLLLLATSVSASDLSEPCNEVAKVARLAAQQRMQGKTESEVTIPAEMDALPAAKRMGTTMAYAYPRLHSFAMLDVAYKYCMVLSQKDMPDYEAEKVAIAQYTYSATHCHAQGKHVRADFERCMTEIGASSWVLLEKTRAYVVKD